MPVSRIDAGIRFDARHPLIHAGTGQVAVFSPTHPYLDAIPLCQMSFVRTALGLLDWGQFEACLALWVLGKLFKSCLVLAKTLRNQQLRACDWTLAWNNLIETTFMNIFISTIWQIWRSFVLIKLQNVECKCIESLNFSPIFPKMCI